EVAAVKEALGFARDATLDEIVEPGVLEYTRGAIDRGAELQAEWQARFDQGRSASPHAAADWDLVRAGGAGAAALAALDEVAASLPAEGTGLATRKTNGAVLQALTPHTNLWGGSADLAGSTNVAVPGEPVSADNPGGEFIRFGIREHAMAAILSGI